MNSLFIRFLLVVTNLLLRFRYRITYKGLDKVKKALKNTPQGTLFLPNHPAAIIDPLLVSIPLLRVFAIRPLVIEYMYYQPLFHRLLAKISALPMPNFSTGFNPLKLKRAEKMLKTISEGLKQGENFLIYPAGTTKLTGKESIGGAFGVHQLLSENPDVNIVLVRMTGLWGSSFSRALTAGDPPDTKKAFKNGFWTLLKNFLFFIPKREVTVEFELAAADFPRKSSKATLNQYLEQWYNLPFGPEGEPLSLISYAFYKKEVPTISAIKKERFDLAQVPQEVRDDISAKVAELAKIPVQQVLPNLLLAEHFGLDSLDIAQILAYLEERYDVTGITPQDLTTVERLFAVATKSYVKIEPIDAVWNRRRWNKKKAHRKRTISEAETIPEAFFKASDSQLFQLIAADPFVGPISYFKMKKIITLLSDKIKMMPGERIGILLPASCTSLSLIIACQFAGKTPVMINWTVGGKHLDAVVEQAGIQVVLSSWKFLDNLENVDVTCIEEMIYLLEELKTEIGFLELLTAHCKAFFPSRFTSFSHLNKDDEAVVLFTSGTESMPKGVPLTHENILSNQRAALEVVHLYEDDTLLAFLPPFHSFGFSMTGLLPLLSGLKVVFYPNPTDSKRLAKAIDRWKVSVIVSAPTFLKNILLYSSQESLATARLFISGAEKAPQELFSSIKRLCPQATLYEGYGITECAPVISVNTTGSSVNGVGHAIPGVSIVVVDPENMSQERPTGEVGIVLCKGPNVFHGYLRDAKRDPFVLFQNERWYDTGDLGSISKNANLTISGRLKRFIKIGGEMISLAAIEEALATQTDTKGEQFAIHVGEDLVGKPLLTLFSVQNFSVQTANQMLRKYGFSNLVKIDNVIVVEAIPVTATGKVSYRALEMMIKGNV